MLSGAWHSIDDALAILNHPGHPNQKVHGGRGGGGVAGLPRTSGAESPTEAARATNPNYGTTGGMEPRYPDAPAISHSARTGKVESRQYTPDMGPLPSGAYEENCTNAVMAFEMRMRGYDVQAAPMDILDRSGFAAGRTYAEGDQQLASQWRAPGGGEHGRSFAGQQWRSFKEIDREVESWPEGGRGYMTTGKHVFSVVKRGGKAEYVESQFDATPDRIVTTQYKNKYGSEAIGGKVQEAKVIRLDDLEPTDAILDSVVAAGQ